ncbi:MAG: hypothetical protein R3E87_24225 [Burkholderiaceae bacterium]
MRPDLHAHARPPREAVNLSLALFRRTIGAKYRKSYFGYLWILIPALLITAGVWLANRSGVIDPGVTPLPYPLFVLVGVLIWQVFAEAIEVPYRAIEGARSYLTRVMFPREAILLVQIYEGSINLVVRFVFASLLTLLFHDSGVTGHLLLLLAFLTAFGLAIGIGLFLAPFMILFADLQNTMRLLLTYGIFLTPAFYVPSGGLFGSLVDWNPVAPSMRLARDGLAGLPVASDPGLAWAMGCAVVLCAAGVVFIKGAVPHLVERMLLGGR